MHVVIAIIPYLYASYTGLVLMSSSLLLSGLLLKFKFGTVIPLKKTFLLRVWYKSFPSGELIYN